MEPRAEIVPFRPNSLAAKPNELIDVVFRVGPNGPLGPLQHEALNVLMAYAQFQLREAPPSFDVTMDTIQNVFNLRLSDVAGLCGYSWDRPKGEGGSKNVAYFCAALDGLRDRSVSLSGFKALEADGYLDEDDRKGRARPRSSKSGFMQLVADVEANPTTDTIRVEFPKRLCWRLFTADDSTPISSIILDFTSRSANILYELYLQHLSAGKLPRKPWRVWSRLLRSEASPHNQLRDFNKLLNRAIEQVNSKLTDHQLVRHTVKQRGADDEVWIEIAPKAQPDLHLPQRSDAHEIVDRLVKCHVGRATAALYVQRFGSEQCLRNLDYALEQHKRRPRKNLGGAIIDAIGNDYAARTNKPLAPLSPKPPGLSFVGGSAQAVPVGVDNSSNSSAQSSARSGISERTEAENALRRIAEVTALMPQGQPLDTRKWIDGLDRDQRKRLLKAFTSEADGATIDFVRGAGEALDKAAVVHVLAKWIERRGAFPDV